FIFVSIFDDIYDNYSTLEESKLFTEAIERWDEEAAEELPGYMKFFYKKVLTTMKSIETDLKLQGNKHVDYVKNLLIDATRCFYNEVKWRSEGADQVAATVEEHLKISVPSSCCMHVPVYAFVAMGNDVTTD
ncbi:terpene synthase/cyclase family protein, partial [Shewanella sp. A3A]|nr:terpene synthase/cyclase family protein [Shewanella ferrihydritica]